MIQSDQARTSGDGDFRGTSGAASATLTAAILPPCRRQTRAGQTSPELKMGSLVTDEASRSPMRRKGGLWHRRRIESDRDLSGDAVRDADGVRLEQFRFSPHRRMALSFCLNTLSYAKPLRTFAGNAPEAGA